MRKPGFTLFTLFSVALALTLSASAQQSAKLDTGTASSPQKDAGSSTASAKDQHFIKEAADGGLAEVELGQLATQKASDPQVKAFGQRMVDDHSKANEQLKKLASDKGISVPSSPSAKHQATKNKLSKLSGDQFDKAYMAEMLKDHKKDVADFKQQSTSAKDPDVKKFAAETLPTLEDHLKQAQSISPTGSAKTSASAKPSPSKP